MKITRTLVSLLITALLSLAFFNFSAMAQTPAPSCAASATPSNNNTVAICFSSPADGSTLTGDVPVTVDTNLNNESTDVQSMVFTLNNTYLLTDYSSPFAFTVPSEKWADGSYTLSVVAEMRVGKPVDAQITVKFSNGNAKAPVNTRHFTPSIGNPPASGQPFVVAAAGDGASGEDTATQVIDTISLLNPNLFLYLGDVYESGSMAEFFNWYGSGSSNFSALRAITDPTIGNHEYTNGVGGAGYFDYWDNIPNYYSFNAGGWHFISLNSNLAKLGGNPPGVIQYYWLQNDLSKNAQACTIVYYHQPLFNIGAEGPTPVMASVWALLAKYKVPIVLNGHDHDYQRWVPLDGTGKPSPNGITEFVAGGGGHGLADFVTTDSRVAYSNDLNPTAFGVLSLQLSQTGANFSYHSSDGSILDSGFIPCGPGASANTAAAGTAVPASSATATPLDPPASTPTSSATALLVDPPTITPFPAGLAVIPDTSAPTEMPFDVDRPNSPFKTPAFLGISAFAGLLVIMIVASLIILARRRA